MLIALPDLRLVAVVGDTGCVVVGRLAALRYLERELVSVPARPFLPGMT